MTCKQLEKQLNLINDVKVEVKKVTKSGRITGSTITYRLSVEHDKFYVAAFTLKDLVKTIERESANGKLTMNARYGKQSTMTINVA